MQSQTVRENRSRTQKRGHTPTLRSTRPVISVSRTDSPASLRLLVLGVRQRIWRAGPSQRPPTGPLGAHSDGLDSCSPRSKGPSPRCCERDAPTARPSDRPPLFSDDLLPPRSQAVRRGGPNLTAHPRVRGCGPPIVESTSRSPIRVRARVPERGGCAGRARQRTLASPEQQQAERDR